MPRTLFAFIRSLPAVAGPFVVNCYAKQNRECTLIDANCCYRMRYML